MGVQEPGGAEGHLAPMCVGNCCARPPGALTSSSGSQRPAPRPQVPGQAGGSSGPQASAALLRRRRLRVCNTMPNSQLGLRVIPRVLQPQPGGLAGRQRAPDGLRTAALVTSESTSIYLRRPRTRHWRDALCISSDDTGISMARGQPHRIAGASQAGPSTFMK